MPKERPKVGNPWGEGRADYRTVMAYTANRQLQVLKNLRLLCLLILIASVAGAVAAAVFLGR